MRATAGVSPYRKVSVSTWADEKVRRLSGMQASGQAMFLMLLVGPQTTSMPGVQPVGRMALAEMLGWDMEGFDKAFREVFEEGLAIADWEARFLFVPKAIIHNPPQSPNVVKSWASTWARVPECPLKDQAWQVIHDALSAMGKSYVDAFKASCPKGCSGSDKKPSAKPLPKASGKASGKASDTAMEKTIANQEQEQEQEQDKEKHTQPDAATAGADVSVAKQPKNLGLRELIALDVDRQHAEDWLKARRAKRLPLTATALDGVQREAEKAGMTLPDAIAKAAAEGWAGFKASWVIQGGNTTTAKPSRLPSAESFATMDYGPGGRL